MNPDSWPIPRYLHPSAQTNILLAVAVRYDTSWAKCALELLVWADACVGCGPCGCTISRTAQQGPCIWTGIMPPCQLFWVSHPQLKWWAKHIYFKPTTRLFQWDIDHQKWCPFTEAGLHRYSARFRPKIATHMETFMKESCQWHPILIPTLA